MPEPAKTRLYLDVDGVINAQMPFGWGRLQNGHAAGYKIRWAPRMVEALAELDVDLCWATTWKQHAATEIGPLISFGEGARHLIEIANPYGDSYGWSIDWKFPAVIDDQYWKPSPFIWLDDEIEQKHIDQFPHALVLPINPRTGISPKDVEQMREYVARFAAVPAVE